MGRMFRPVVEMNDNDYRALDYFEFDNPIKEIRSYSPFLTGGASFASFPITKCSNSVDLIRAIQQIGQRIAKYRLGSKQREVYIHEVTVNKVSATVIMG